MDAACPLASRSCCSALRGGTGEWRMTEERAGHPRPERVESPPPAQDVVRQPLGVWTRAWNISGLRKAALLIVLMAAWEGYARWLDNPLLFPTFSSTLSALASGIVSGQIPRAA